MVSVKWVFTWKADEHGKIAEAKGRRVARVFSQHPGVHCNLPFAPTLSASCIRIMAAIACDLQLDLFVISKCNKSLSRPNSKTSF